MSNAIFGWDNNLLGAALTAGSEAAELPVSNLATEHGDPASAWQTGTGVRTWSDGAWFVGAMPDYRRWRAFALARSNLTAAARVRWRVGPRDSIVERTPVVDLDFAPGWTPPAGASFTRASSAWYFDATGTLTEAANHAPRLAYDPVTLAYWGLLIEPQRTNEVTNPRFEGAVPGAPGTPPTGMTIEMGSGISREIVGVGVEDGIPYMDVRFFGTATANVGPNVQFSGTTTAPAVAPGETITVSCFARLVGGSFAGATNISLTVFEFNASNGVAASGSQFISPTDAPLRTQRFAYTRTIAGADTVRAAHQFRMIVPQGATIDVTVRVGAPQFERGEFPTTPILPPVGAPAAATRANEALNHTSGVDLLNLPDGGALSAEFTVPAAGAAAGSADIVLRADASNDIRLRFVPGGSYVDALVRVGGATQLDTGNIPVSVGGTIRAAVRWTASDVALAANGQMLPGGAPAQWPASLTQLALAGALRAALAIRRVRVYTPAPSDASLLQLGIDGTTLEPATYDSGWLEDGVAGAAAQRVHVAPTEVVGQYVRCDIDDPSNGDGFVRVALAYAGPAWQPRFNIHPETVFASERVAREARTRGGQTWYELLWAERAWEVAHQWTEDADVWAQLLAMEQAASLGRNVLFVPFPASPDANREAVFGPMRLLAPVGFIAPGTKLRTWRARFVERL